MPADLEQRARALLARVFDRRSDVGAFNAIRGEAAVRAEAVREERERITKMCEEQQERWSKEQAALEEKDNESVESIEAGARSWQSHVLARLVRGDVVDEETK